MTIDKSLDQWFRDEMRKSKRSILNRVKADKTGKLAEYLWQRFPMLQDKKYTNGMRLHWLEAKHEDFPNCACKDEGVHQNKSAKCGISGYTSPYCSNECARKEGVKNSHKTKEERYGDPNYRNPEKAAKTNKTRYGVSNPFSSKKVIAEIQKKRKEKGEDLMQKAWKTRKACSSEKFAQFSYNDKIFLQFLDASPLKTFEVRSYTNEERKTLHLKIKQYLHFLQQDTKPNFTVEEWIARKDPTSQPMKWICKEGHHFEACINKHYHKTDNLRCPICMPYLGVGTSKKEQELQQLIRILVLPGTEVQMNTRKVIEPLELDAYVPSLSVAFEFDGLYTHSELFKKPRYHIMKTTRCSSLGIQLVHVFEDEWDDKRELCESMIAQVLGNSEVHDAAELVLKEISSEDADSFTQQNSIIGAVHSTHEVCYGLFDMEDQMLFACAIDGLKANKYEVVCMCNKMHHHVHNALDVCMQHFCQQFKPSYICCKLDRRWYSLSTLHDCKFFNGSFIEKSSFSYVSYGCTFRVSQDEITAEFLEKQKAYDPKKSDDENLAASKFTKIWDAGKLVLTWKRREANAKGATVK